MLTKPFSKDPEACWLSCLTEALLILYIWSAFNHFMKLGNSHLLNSSGPQRNFMACHQSRPGERNAERCFQIKLQFFRLDWHNLSSVKEEPFVELLEQIQSSDSHYCSLHFTLSCTIKSWLWHSPTSFQLSGHVLSAKCPFPEELQLSTHRERQWRNTVIMWGISHADLQSVIKLALTLLLTFTFSAQCHEAPLCTSSKKERATTELCSCYEHPWVCGRRGVLPHDPT